MIPPVEYESTPSRAPRSAAFKRWFGASKVVDERGRPLIVYHGTPRRFEAFEDRYIGLSDDGTAARGFYFSRSAYYPREYALFGAQEGDAPIVLAVYLKMENPLVVDDYRKLPGWALDNKEAVRGIQQRVRDLGYDGIILSHSITDYTTYIVFESTQIKSVNNVGTWSPTDPRMRHNPRRQAPTTDYARLQPDDILRVYHSTTLGDLPSLINGFDATAEHRRLYGGPRHSGIFVAPTEEAASQFGSDVMLELEVQARFLHGTDYSGNIGRASDAHPERMSKAWVTAKYPASFRPLLSESLQQRGEPQALLKGLVSPGMIKRVRYKGKWYSRAEFLRLGLTTSTPENPYAPHALTDAGFDFSSPRYPLPVLFAHIAYLLDATPERIEDAFFLRARSRGAQAVQDLLDNLFIRGQAQDVYTRRIMESVA